jgi:cytochrome c-type biogenesis protein CcmH
MILSRLLAFLLFLSLGGAVFAAALDVRTFDDPAKQQRYENLVKELRCLVCQNQSLADSDADLAQDLRDEVYRIIQSGKSDEEAVEFLVSRYGDFVLYRPPVKPLTILLWAGPALLFALASGMAWRQYAKRRAADGEAPLSPDERARLDRLTSSRDHDA